MILTLHQGEIHALVGEHGAGKSSLAFILSGLLKPVSGAILLKNTPYDYLTAKIARKHNIQLVHQYNVLFDGLSVAENLFVNSDADPSFLYSRKKLIEKAGEYLDRLGFHINPPGFQVVTPEVPASPEDGAIR
ncbi:MAG: ATP-binding cassette domain-containing protein [bacterium]|nr:ATP-binding cassette domain-containing protein [bacterium]